MHFNERLLSSGIFEKSIRYKRHEFIKKSETVDSTIYYVQEGSLKIMLNTNNTEQIIRFGYAGDFITALDSFFTLENSEYAIQAIKQSTLLQAKRNDFLSFIASNEENQTDYQHMLETLILQQLAREKDLLLESPYARYHSLLNRNPKIFQVIPLKHIANYLRMSPETLSRLRKS